ncbi:MAG: hypothetical protein WAV05_19960 [Anaerolineales bacterium]
MSAALQPSAEEQINPVSIQQHNKRYVQINAIDVGRLAQQPHSCLYFSLALAQLQSRLAY